MNDVEAGHAIKLPLSRETEIFSDLCRVIQNACDPSPIGVFVLERNDGGHDSEFRSLVAIDWLSGLGLSGEDLSALIEGFCQSTLLDTRQLRLVAHNIAAEHAFSKGDHSVALRYAEEAFGHWQHDVYNHRLILKCKTALGASDVTRDEGLADYLDQSYCPRPFEHFETTFDKRVYLCSPDYLTAPVADINILLGANGKSEIDPSEVDRVAWNTPAARYVRRSIIAGEFKACSPLTCPLIQGRLLPSRRLDRLPLHLVESRPELVQFSYYDHSIYYYGSRVYAVPFGQALVAKPIADHVLVSYTIEDLQGQIAESVPAGLLPLEPIDIDWFRQNRIADSVVLTLKNNSEQGRVRERMAFSPRELMMTHDNSCNISCPSCRSHTVIASRVQTEEYDRLVPIFLGMLKDAERLILSGSGDPFASRHFRRLMRAIASKETEFYGKIDLPEGFRINLMTNGLLLNRSSYEDFGLRGLIGIISLSMDSCEKNSFERIRRGSKWEELLAAIDFLQEIRLENPDMVLISYFTVQASNFDQIPRFISFCRSKGFQQVQLNMIRNFGAWSKEEFEAENIGSPSHPQFANFLDVMAKLDLSDTFLILGNAGDYHGVALQRIQAQLPLGRLEAVKAMASRFIRRCLVSGDDLASRKGPKQMKPIQSAAIEFCGKSAVHRQRGQTFVRRCGATVSTLMQCELCGYCAFEPKPSAEELNEHYQTDYAQASSPHYDFDLEYSRLDLPAVADHLIETIRKFGCHAEQLEAHDYGCAMGNLVHALRQAGVNATGHDINQSWITQARTRLGDAVSHQSFEEIFHGSTRQLHLVTMLHTLEHMPHPSHALRAIREHLDGSGIVYICVPNALFLVADVLGREADENFLFPTHLHYFTPKSMQCLLNAAGLRALHIESRQSHLSPRGRDSLLSAARQMGFADDEAALMSKLAGQFRTAELFTIAVRDDNPMPADSRLPENLATIADFEHRISKSGKTWMERISEFASSFPFQKLVKGHGDRS